MPFQSSTHDFDCLHRAAMETQEADLLTSTDGAKPIVPPYQSRPLSTNPFGPFALIDVVNAAVRSCKADLILHRVTVIRHFHALPILFGDGRTILQIMTTLIKNAVASIQAAEQAEGRLILRVDTRETWACTEIEHNGNGIPAESLASYFEQSEALRSCASSARAVHGQLSVKSAGLARGATIYFELPIDLLHQGRNS